MFSTVISEEQQSHAILLEIILNQTAIAAGPVVQVSDVSRAISFCVSFLFIFPYRFMSASQPPPPSPYHPPFPFGDMFSAVLVEALEKCFVLK